MLRTFIAALLMTVVAGCASGRIAVPSAILEPGPDTSLPIVEPVTEHRLGPTEILRITVAGEPTLSGMFEIAPLGAITYPFLGETRAAGLTPTEMARSLTERLKAGYVRNPRVTVEVTRYRNFYILGAVTKPGAYPFAPGMTVYSAAATAGGFSYRANMRRVFIRHEGETAEREFQLGSGTPVRPGDTLRIAERIF